MTGSAHHHLLPRGDQRTRGGSGLAIADTSGVMRDTRDTEGRTRPAPEMDVRVEQWEEVLSTECSRLTAL